MGLAQYFVGMAPDTVMVAVKKHPEGVAITINHLAPQNLVRDICWVVHTS